MVMANGDGWLAIAVVAAAGQITSEQGSEEGASKQEAKRLSSFGRLTERASDRPQSQEPTLTHSLSQSDTRTDEQS